MAITKLNNLLKKKPTLKKYNSVISEAYANCTNTQRDFFDFILVHFAFHDCVVFSHEQNILCLKFLCKIKNKGTNSFYHHKIWLYFDIQNKTLINRYLTKGDYFVDEEHYYNNEFSDMKKDILRFKEGK